VTRKREKPADDTEQAAEELRASEHLYRSVFEHMSEGLAYCRMVLENGEPRDFVYLAVNPAFETLTGLRNVTGRKVSEVVPGIREADPQLFDIYARVSSTGTPEKFEMFVEALGLWFSVSVYSPGTGFFVAMFDVITGRKRAEAALRESEERFRRVFEEGRLGMVMANVVDGTFTRANGAFCEMLGYEEEELKHLTFAAVTHPEHRSLDVEAIKGLWEGQILQYKTEKRYLRKDGGAVWGSLTASLIRSADGKPLYSLAMIEDITERKRAEAEKARLEAQLRQAQKMESVGRLAGGVAHDSNNMLAVILGNAELALIGLDRGQPVDVLLREIHAAASRSADLTARLLAFARKQTIVPTALDLNAAVGAMLTMLRRLIGEDVDLLWRPGDNLWRTKIDPTQIDQILANLCVNARDAIAGVGKFTVETDNAILDDAYCASNPGCVPGEYVRLAVSDDGCGMDRETLSHLFEPFFTTKAVGRGTGLGLPTVYGIVKQNHGFIDVTSEPGAGTTFTIYLPRHVFDDELAQTERTVDPANRGHETILLVEDEPAVLNMTVGLLSGLGYTVLAVPSPVEAIRVAWERAAEIHLLMTDVVMPEMNGRDLAAKLLTLYPHLKRLFMSGHAADVIARHGVLGEGVHFLQKPFSRDVLAAKVREALDRD
jgi:PAS domain S-box-containing protein